MKTLKQKIEVMTAADGGARIQMKPYGLPDNYWTPAPFECTWNWSTLDYRVAEPEIAPGHNPDKLTVDQVGMALGWRLLEPDEIKKRSEAIRNIQMWKPFEKTWSAVAQGVLKDASYRTKLSREQLAALDNPPPKRRLPLGPEDFPPGTIIRNTKQHSGYLWRTVNGVAPDCIIICSTLADNVLEIRYPTMIDQFERSLDGGKAWLPCYREQ